MGAARAQIEWLTVTLAIAVHGLWFAVLASHEMVPHVVTIALLSVAIAWHGSLQHEVLHGHPFPAQGANDIVGALPLSLRLPYLVYRGTHLDHHRSVLTDPVGDVESFYLSAETWSRLPGWRRRGAVFHHTLLGRMLIGPIVSTVELWSSQWRAIRRGDRALRAIWVRHVIAVALLLWLIVAVAGVPLWVYLLGCYGGHSLTLVRSFAEHRWVPGERSRSAMVRSGRGWSLLFLNNNLHDAHHARPSVAWYRLPAVAQELECDAAAAEGAGLYRGYGEVGRRFLLRPFDHPLHPLERAGQLEAAR